MLRTEPQRHREDTEPRTSQTRRHEGTKSAQRHPTIAICPQITQITQMVVLETRARGEVSRPSSNDGREPLDRLIAPNASVRRDDPDQRPALSESAGLATSLPLLSDRRCLPSQIEEREGGPDAPSARRPGGSLAATNARVRSRRAFPRVDGDRQIAGCSAVNLRHWHIKESICVHLRDLRANGMDGRSSCLRVFVFAMCDGSVSELCASVPLWFFGRRPVGTA